MNTTGLSKAADRLRRMASAVKRLEDASTSKSAAEAWEDFILAAGSFYSILEQASKTSGKEVAWFGRLKGKRKSDQLLQYIHHARNTEEHGCQRTSASASRSVILANKGDEIRLTSDGSNWIASHIKGDVVFANDAIMLVTVKDEKFGDSFDPPTEHMGKILDDRSALAISRAALDYFGGVLSEAIAMAK